MENEQPVQLAKKSNPFAVVILLAVIVVAFGALYLFGIRRSLMQMAEGLEGGVSQAEVVKQMGEPSKKEPLGDKQEVWTYTRSFPQHEEVYLVFEKDGAFSYPTDEKPE